MNRVKKKADGTSEADFFNVSAWQQLGENCAKYLAKGRKVAVTGSVSCRTFQRNDGTTGASMEIQARDVEFLSSRTETENEPQTATPKPDSDGFTQVEMDSDELPF